MFIYMGLHPYYSSAQLLCDRSTFQFDSAVASRIYSDIPTSIDVRQNTAITHSIFSALLAPDRFIVDKSVLDGK